MTRPFVFAVDLGQTHDHTAIIGLRRAEGNVLEGIGIMRLPLGMGYPAQVEYIAALIRRSEFASQCVLAVDATGVGAAVVDLLRPAVRPTPFYAVTITGGDQVTKDMHKWRVLKRDLIGAAQVAFQQRRIKLPRASAEAPTLIEELLAYQVNISANGHDTYGNDWRQAPHDDLVLALAIGVYVADHTKGARSRTYGDLMISTRAQLPPLWP
jgi:hypothetical protein